jgi:hypothetical protein
LGLLEIEVAWDLEIGGQTASVQVEEVEFSLECTGTVALDLDVLVNGIGELESAGMQLYPNPASDIVRVEGLLGWSNRGQIQCINALGQVVKMQTFRSVERIALPVNELPNGIYLIRLVDASMNEKQPVQASVLIQR